jgi:hypothetical protein
MRIEVRLSWPLILILLFVTQPLASAQAGSGEDLQTLLRDAAYVLNRYEETTTGMDVEIDSWNVEASVRQSSKDEIAAVTKNVDLEKPRLNGLLTKRDIPASDLFDVYQEVTEVGSELNDQSSNFANWGNDPSKSVDIARLAARANVLGAKIGVQLRHKLAEQDVRLNACSGKR